LTGAIALAVVLVIAVAGISMAMQGQRTGPGATTRPRPVQPNRPTINPRRSREKRSTPPPPPPADMPPPVPEPELRGPELLRTGVPAEAKVISVVDERTIGPVTRSRLTLRVEPQEGDPFEVTTRFAFPTPAARAQVKVGGTVPVKYDKDDHTRIVVDLPAE
jgi:hypothetical protein